MPKRQSICGTHNDIGEVLNRINLKADKIMSLLDGVEDQLAIKARELANDIDSECRNAIGLVKEALESGQAMEQRLHEYKDTIEGLGFKRVK